MALSIDFDGADALIQRVDRLVDHRQQDAVDDEGREILRDGRDLAEAFDELARSRERLVLGRDAADQLDQLHHRHRVHEMHADEALGPVGGGRQTRDGDGRGVAGEHRAFLQLGSRSAKILRLTVSSSVAASMTRSAWPTAACRRIADALQRLLHVGIGDQAARDLPRHVAFDDDKRLVDGLLLDVVHEHVVAGQRNHMGDAVAHLAGTDDGDRLDAAAASGSWPLRLRSPGSPALLVLRLASMTALLLQPPDRS